MATGSNQTIIIKKVKKASHAHHGGAWKIAYADFVTAMMAFFLLLWLISMTTPEQREGLANYFAPPNVSETTSGSGGIMGGTAMDQTGAQMAGSSALVSLDLANGELSGGTAGDVAVDGGNRSPEDMSAETEQMFHSAAMSIRQAWQAMPELVEMADNLLVEVTEEGLDIQLIDQEGRAMFPEGSKYPFDATRAAIAAIAPVLQQLPHQIRISGHTAAGGVFADPRYGPWELSADRANVTRSLLTEFGLADDRVQSVVGRAISEPFFPNDPYMAANERIRITVLAEAPPVPLDLTP